MSYGPIQTAQADILSSNCNAHFHGVTRRLKPSLSVLTKKGYIQIDNQKKPFHYSATISEKAQLDQETDVLLEQVCHKQNGNLLHTLIDKATLSQDDIQELVNALKEKAASAPTTVACNCLPGQCNCHHHHN